MSPSAANQSSAAAKQRNLILAVVCVVVAVAIAVPAMIIGGIKCLGLIFEGIGNYGFDAPEVEVP